MLDELFDGAEELSLFVPGVFLAADVGLLVVLADLAALAHLLHAGTHLHSIILLSLINFKQHAQDDGYLLKKGEIKGRESLEEIHGFFSHLTA